MVVFCQTMLDVVQDGRAVARATLRLVASADAGLLPPASGSLSFRWSLALLAHFLCAAYFPAVVLRRLFPWGFSALALRLCFAAPAVVVAAWSLRPWRCGRWSGVGERVAAFFVVVCSALVVLSSFALCLRSGSSVFLELLRRCASALTPPLVVDVAGLGASRVWFRAFAVGSVLSTLVSFVFLFFRCGGSPPLAVPDPLCRAGAQAPQPNINHNDF